MALWHHQTWQTIRLISSPWDSDSDNHIPIIDCIYIYTPNTLYPYYIPILPCKKYTIDGSSAAHAPLEVNETKRAALIREEKKEAELQDGTPQL